MILEDFLEKDHGQLLQWINSEELNYLWGGPSYTFPLTIEKIRTHCDNVNVFPFIFRIENSNAGFIELVRESGSHFRIARVFIAESFRGQGLAKVLIEQTIEKAEKEFDASHLSLAVFEANCVARNCYESAGFQTVGMEAGTRTLNDKPLNLLRMAMALPRPPIREAILEDTADIHRLSQQLGYAAESYSDSLHRIKTILAADNHRVWVCEVEGKIQGWLHLFIAMRLTSPDFAEIGGLVVDSNCRRSGIGRALVRHATSWTKARQLPLRVRCNENRTDANKFYESTGWKKLKTQNVYQFCHPRESV